MRRAQVEKPGWILLPAVTLTMAYGGVIACWFLYIACTMKFPTIFGDEPYRLIDTKLYWIFSGANLALAIWLLASLGPARRSGRTLGRAHIAGIAASLALLGVFQFGAQALHADIGNREGNDPAVIAAFVAEQGEDERRVLECVRAAVKRARPGIEEALSRGELNYKYGDRFSHRLVVSPGEVRMNMIDWSTLPPEIDEGPWSLEASANNRRSGNLVIPCPLDDNELERLRGVVISLAGHE